MLILFGAVAAVCGGAALPILMILKGIAVQVNLTSFHQPFDKQCPASGFVLSTVKSFPQSFVDDARMGDLGEAVDISNDDKRDEMFETITW